MTLRKNIPAERDKQEEKIQILKRKEEEDVTQILSQKYGISYVDLRKMSVDLDYLKLIPENKAREGKIVVFQGVGKKAQIAVQNPELESTKNIIKELSQEEYIPQLFLSSLSGLSEVWEKYKEVPKFVELSKGTVEISSEKISELLEQDFTVEHLKTMFLENIQSKKERSVSDLIEIILGGALKMKASDVHIEPFEDNVKLRFRFDGVLHDILDFKLKSYKLLISRIKLVSEMKLNIKQKAQDGRFSIKINDTEIEVRSSILPGPYGESVVLRILNPETIDVKFENLGLQKNLEEILEKEIKKPNGMILTTGPTGSGKTTTLYTFLKKINNPEIKIITIEEPIEYHLEGITQTQTKPEKNYTFSTGLRAIVRQDPDVIMIGEIRDKETADTSLNAALTGHLVLSTLHTNDAAGTIPRLIELGAKTAVIAPSINITLAQRLIRKLCSNCKVAYSPTPEEKEILEKFINTLPESIEKPNLKNIKLYKANQCEKCRNTGYNGRIGIFEAIIVDEEMEKLILNNPSTVEIKETAKSQGIIDIQQDAILKIIEGITSIDEVKRVIEI